MSPINEGFTSVDVVSACKEGRYGVIPRSRVVEAVRVPGSNEAVNAPVLSQKDLSPPHWEVLSGKSAVEDELTFIGAVVPTH